MVVGYKTCSYLNSTKHHASFISYVEIINRHTLKYEILQLTLLFYRLWSTRLFSYKTHINLESLHRKCWEMLHVCSMLYVRLLTFPKWDEYNSHIFHTLFRPNATVVIWLRFDWFKLYWICGNWCCCENYCFIHV